MITTNRQRSWQLYQKYRFPTLSIQINRKSLQHGTNCIKLASLPFFVVAKNESFCGIFYFKRPPQFLIRAKNKDGEDIE